MTREYLIASRAPEETLSWLNETYLPALVGKFNVSGVRQRLGLYAGERIPENERNLTDVRTRLGQVIEYELARLGNDLLVSNGIADLFWTYVVANRFPDLELRDAKGNRGLRIEVKCLQSVAEEKAANFDTLKKDIRPSSDFVVVFLWEWLSDGHEVAWERAPHLIGATAFHAASLAELRDYKWLNHPPGGLTKGFQGFDLRYAVTFSNGSYKEEEHNYGKLLRIWPQGETYPNPPPLISRTMKEYLRFEDAVIQSGLVTLAKQWLPKLTNSNDFSEWAPYGTHVGYKSGRVAFVLKRRVKSGQSLLMRDEVDHVFVFSDKYQWSCRTKATVTAFPLQSGNKPKLLKANCPL